MTKQASPAGISEKVIRLLEIYALIAQKQLLIPFSLCLFPEKGYDPDGVMSELVNYDRSPDCTSEGFPATVAGAVEIS